MVCCELTAAYNLAEQKLKGKQVDLTLTLTPTNLGNSPNYKTSSHDLYEQRKQNDLTFEQIWHMFL